jgi:hypothetical protein
MTARKNKPEKFLFRLSELSLKDLKRASLKKDSGNVGRMINRALQWYIQCMEAKDKGLESFLEDKTREEEAKLEK